MNKLNYQESRDRLIDGEQDDCMGGLGGRGIKQKGKRIHGHGKCNGVVIMGCEGNIRG